MKKIGILYVKGSLPNFENFGELPTHVLKDNGLVNGKEGHKVLDGLIIPGGSIMESVSISPEVENVIRKMNNQGKFILGMCSGFQVLAHKTDIGRKSPCPVERPGLGILDVTFHPLIGTDRVEAEVMDESFLTKGMIGESVTGFHCHTYGDIKGDAQPVFFSKVKRTDYTDNPRKILSGVRNDEGNVVGTMVHASLDENPSLRDNILAYLDTDERDIQEIQSANQDLVEKIKGEIGIGWDIHSDNRVFKGLNDISQMPPFLMIASTGSDSGKTFLTTGLVGALRKKGYRVGVLKVGPDIRDLVPALYLNKEKMENFSSIQIGGLGWKDLKEVIRNVKGKNYDLILIEGVMSIFTGLLNEKTPFSAAEIARAGNIPTLLVTGCNKGGIETAAVDLASHVNIMDNLGIKTTGVILNKVYHEGIAETASDYLKKTTGLEWVGRVPKTQLAARGGTPEVEIKLEDFCLKAMETVEKHLDVAGIMKMAQKPYFDGYISYKEILKDFMN
ncbi:AAA family ATPase [Methanobacterium petrolearium]|uniref:AAA family ATPase n=1 Tax=Methanobacterium petrolearium TaxID=710190 RepID=UPI001AE46C98|nr:AAA family ATPase [Methanobacterium petrolearium]MBP1944894.1 cobyric acid synthase [Methanobacterium petrolearium]BDZ70200.1 cobyrinic acid a,c-diamide synthase [Methanobacterium petrolearium]